MDVTPIIDVIQQITLGLTLVGIAALGLAVAWELTAALLPFQLPRFGVMRIIGIAFLFVVLPGFLATITALIPAQG